MTTKKTIPAAAKNAVKKLPVGKSTADAVAKKTKKEPKVKIVRDSFTMPQSEYQKIAEIKETCLEAGLSVKKSEVLRAGLRALAKLNAVQLQRALTGLEKIKTGRPKKH
ncbi:MAG: hypothetical protein NUV75_10110 [Gallionella sp.]|nr:hypothetical protein [Gallionella sp.]